MRDRRHRIAIPARTHFAYAQHCKMIAGATDIALDASQHLTMILAGDIGATKTLLEVGDLRQGRWRPAFIRRYLGADHRDFDSVLRAFLLEWEAHHGSPLALAPRPL